MHNEFKNNPAGFWRKYEEWFKPMNQLQCGVFISINWESKDFKFTEYCNENSDIKLEYTQLGPNYAKIIFEYNETLPYRVSTGILSLICYQKNQNYFKNEKEANKLENERSRETVC